jgi:signal transduction histidine kinase
VDSLFEIFSADQLALSKKSKARGLSLCVVKKLCDLMNIRIEVESKLGVGTTMRLILPCRAL